MLVPDPQLPAAVALAKELAPDQEFILVRLAPASWATEHACVEVVDRLVSEEGGERILGWAFWIWPGVFLEAEFHAVWKKPGGELIDPTPRKRQLDAVLFLPDPRAVVDTWQKDNVRKPLVHRREILDFIQIKERIFRAQNRGEEAHSKYFTPTPHLDFLHAEEQKITRKLIARFGHPPPLV
jgi:hypothetical protein